MDRHQKTIALAHLDEASAELKNQTDNKGHNSITTCMYILVYNEVKFIDDLNTTFIEQVKYFHALGDRCHVCKKVRNLYTYIVGTIAHAETADQGSSP